MSFRRRKVPSKDRSSNKEEDSGESVADRSSNAENEEEKCKIMMILSRAKTMDLSPLGTTQTKALPHKTLTQPMSCRHASKTRTIARTMKNKTESELMKLLGISKALGSKSKAYWDEFDLDYGEHGAQEKTSQEDSDPDEEDAKPCILCFSGAAYQGLQASTCNSDEFEWLQKSLRIVDPVYGLLRPLDVIQPYRLEMGTKGLRLLADKDENDETKSKSKALAKGQEPTKLAEYWRTPVTNQLLEELAEPDTFVSPEQGSVTKGILLNLASDEYSSAVDSTQFLPSNSSAPGTFVKVIFQEQGRVVTIYAKRARGLMARYIARIQATTLQQVRDFQDEGYRFVEKDSDDTTLVFDRDKNWKTKSSSSSSAKPSDQPANTKSRKRSTAEIPSDSTKSERQTRSKRKR